MWTAAQAFISSWNRLPFHNISTPGSWVKLRYFMQQFVILFGCSTRFFEGMDEVLVYIPSHYKKILGRMFRLRILWLLIEMCWLSLLYVLHLKVQFLFIFKFIICCKLITDSSWINSIKFVSVYLSVYCYVLATRLIVNNFKWLP